MSSLSVFGLAWLTQNWLQNIATAASRAEGKDVNALLILVIFSADCMRAVDGLVRAWAERWERRLTPCKRSTRSLARPFSRIRSL